MIRSRTARVSARVSVVLLARGLRHHDLRRPRRQGTSNGKDPNSVSSSQAAAMAKALADRVAQMKQEGTLNSNGDPTNDRT